MEKRYWIGRRRASMAMARAAATAEVRLLHYELAGRYSIKAAQCTNPRKLAPGSQRALLGGADSSFFQAAEVASGQDDAPEARSGGRSVGDGR